MIHSLNYRSFSFLVITALALIITNRAYAFQNESVKTGEATRVINHLAKNSSSHKEPTGRITRQEVLTAALLNNPRLQNFDKNIRISEARLLHAKRLPNPELDFEIEEFGGRDELSGFNSAETTLMFEQLLEFGGKRKKRVKLAQLDQKLSKLNYETVKISVIKDTSTAFLKVLAAQERLKLMKKNHDLAKNAYDAIFKKVQAGETSPLDLSKAKILMEKEKISSSHLSRELDAVKNELAATWGSNEPLFDAVEGSFSIPKSLPTIDALERQIKNNPTIARWPIEINHREMQIDIAKSKAIPNMKIGAGVRRFNENNNNAAILNISLPFPIFNRNKGGILEAGHELEKAHLKQHAVHVRLSKTLKSSYKRMLAAFEEAWSLEKILVPETQHAYDNYQIAYTEGKVGYLELLDAQRTLFDILGQKIEAVVTYNMYALKIEALTGLPLSKVTDASSPIQKKGEYNDQ